MRNSWNRMATSDARDPARSTLMDSGIDASSATDRSDSSYPTLITPRLRFRPFALADITALTTLAGERRIADTTIGVPHPYTTEFARMWMASHSAVWENPRALHWAPAKVGDGRIVGYAGLHHIDRERGQAELPFFWVGCDVERASDAIEWSAAVVEFALTQLDMKRVYALQLDRHPLAGRVLSAIGMRREGLVRKRILKEGLVEDVVCWATLRSDWHKLASTSVASAP
jgi:[ribosomal protein S5]-alanine N-acetyltransferase